MWASEFSPFRIIATLTVRFLFIKMAESAAKMAEHSEAESEEGAAVEFVETAQHPNEVDLDSFEADSEVRLFRVILTIIVAEFCQFSRLFA